MNIVQNRKEWRNNTVIRLKEIDRLSVADAIKEAKQLEEYVFQDDFIIEVKDFKKREALKNFIESLNA